VILNLVYDEDGSNCGVAQCNEVPFNHLQAENGQKSLLY
jgi:hypothetical protein